MVYGQMSRFELSTIVWLGWLAVFAVLELPAVFVKSWPWEPLSDWTWRLENLSSLITWVVLIGMAILLVHLVARFPR